MKKSTSPTAILCRRALSWILLLLITAALWAPAVSMAISGDALREGLQSGTPAVSQSSLPVPPLGDTQLYPYRDMIDKPRVYDGAEVFTPSEIRSLEEMYRAAGDKREMDFVIITSRGNLGKGPMAYADDFYDYNGYADSGALFLIDVEERDMWVSTKGAAIDAIDRRLDRIQEASLDAMSHRDDYYSAAVAVSKQFYAATGPLFGLPQIPPFIVLGLILTVIIVFIIRARYARKDREPVIDPAGNMQAYNEHNNDVFVRSYVTRVRRSDDSDSGGGGGGTHTSSSGSSHGGGGWKF
jgi:uncharacterized protein